MGLLNFDPQWLLRMQQMGGGQPMQGPGQTATPLDGGQGGFGQNMKAMMGNMAGPMGQMGQQLMGASQPQQQGGDPSAQQFSLMMQQREEERRRRAMMGGGGY